jgi:hypothetical protein
MTMTRTRKWAAATAGLVVLILAAGWFLLVSPKHGDAATLRGQAAGQESTNAGLHVQIATLKAQQGQLPEQEAKLATARQQVPLTPALPAYIRSLSAAATQAGVEFESLTPAQPIGLAVTNAIAASAGVSTATGLAQANQLEQMTLQLIVQGPYASIERFIALLEQERRVTLVTALLVDNNATTKLPDPSVQQATITVRVFTISPLPVTLPAGTPATTAPVSPTSVSQ